MNHWLRQTGIGLSIFAIGERQQRIFFFSLNDGKQVDISSSWRFAGWCSNTREALFLINLKGSVVVRRASFPSLKIISDTQFEKSDFLNNDTSNDRSFMTSDDGRIIAYETNWAPNSGKKINVTVSEVLLEGNRAKSLQHRIQIVFPSNPIKSNNKSSVEMVSPSPKGTRLLWREDGARLPLFKRFLNFIPQINSDEKQSVSLYTTNLDGTERRELGEFESKPNDYERDVQDDAFTPDSKSIRFTVEKEHVKRKNDESPHFITPPSPGVW